MQRPTYTPEGLWHDRSRNLDRCYLARLWAGGRSECRLVVKEPIYRQRNKGPKSWKWKPQSPNRSGKRKATIGGRATKNFCKRISHH